MKKELSLQNGQGCHVKVKTQKKNTIHVPSFERSAIFPTLPPLNANMYEKGIIFAQWSRI